MRGLSSDCPELTRFDGFRSSPNRTRTRRGIRLDLAPSRKAKASSQLPMHDQGVDQVEAGVSERLR